MLTWLDRLTLSLAPRWTMRRVRARAALDLFERNYEAASMGRRTQGWRKTSGDADAALFGGLARLRDTARDLIRNNPYAESAAATIADHTVGWGLVAKPAKGTPRVAALRFMPAWRAWADSTACDADGRHDFAGLQKLASRTIASDGEVLVRRRWRRMEDGLPIPLQLQVLEADYLDTFKDGIASPTGGEIVQGVEFDAIGRRAAYWLYADHPGSRSAGVRSGFGQSVRIPATEILHVFKTSRPGQTRGASWFAPVTLRMKDFDEYEDAALLKQKIAACLAVLTTDVDGTTPPLGEASSTEPKWDMLEPGMISNLAPGRAVTVVEPPSVSEHAPYAQTVLRAIAAGLGVTYEDLCGDYTNMPFSAARMSRLRHWARVEDWRWRMLVPQFCDPIWRWANEAAIVAAIIREPLAAEWTAPPLPMIEPDREGLAVQRNIRTGIQTLSDAIRERGYDPGDHLAEYAADNALLDKLGIVLDSDARYTTQQGGPRTASGPGDEEPTTDDAPPTPAGSTNGTRPKRDPVERAFDMLERAFAQKYAQPIHVTTGPTHLNVDRGAIQNHIAAPAAPAVTVENPLTIADGAFRTTVEGAAPAQIHVATPPVHVAAPVTIADGAVRVEVAPSPPAVVSVAAPEIHVAPPSVAFAEGAIATHVAAPPPAEISIVTPPVRVDAPVTIAEGAVRVDVPPPPPTVVTVEPTVVNVAPPNVTVEPTVVNVAPPDVHVDVESPKAEITIQSPTPEPKISIIRPRQPRPAPPPDEPE